MGKFPGRATIPATFFLMFYLLWFCQQRMAKAPQAKCHRCTFLKYQQHELPPDSGACFTLLLSKGRSCCRPGAVGSLCTYHPLCTGFPVWPSQGEISGRCCQPSLHQGHTVRLVNMLEKTQITTATTSEEVLLSKQNLLCPNFFLSYFYTLCSITATSNMYDKPLPFHSHLRALLSVVLYKWSSTKSEMVLPQTTLKELWIRILATVKKYSTDFAIGANSLPPN